MQIIQCRTGRLMRTLKNSVKKLRGIPPNQSAFKQSREGGISVLVSNRLPSFLPKGVLWRLSLLNIAVLASAIVLSGLAVYNTVCFLVYALGTLNDSQQSQFNAILFTYLLIFSVITIVGRSVLHF